MIEVSLWVPVFILEFFAAAALMVSLLWYQGRAQRLKLVRKIERLTQEIADRDQAALDAPVAFEPMPGNEAPEAGPAKLVLLSQDDVDAAERPPRAPAPSAAAEGEADVGAEEVCRQLLEKNDMLANHLNGVLERSAELGMKLGSLRGTEGLDDGVKALIQEAIDHSRQTDEVLVEAADRGMEVDETARHLQIKLSEAAPDPPGGGIDHVSLNEILMARADGQSEEELAQLREEVRQRLLGPDPATLGESAAASEELTEQVTVLQAQLSREASERRAIESRLTEVTEEYQRLFEQFQPSA